MQLSNVGCTRPVFSYLKLFYAVRRAVPPCRPIRSPSSRLADPCFATRGSRTKETELISAVAEAEWHHQQSGQEVDAHYMYTHNGTSWNHFVILLDNITGLFRFLLYLPLYKVFWYRQIRSISHACWVGWTWSRWPLESSYNCY